MGIDLISRIIAKGARMVRGTPPEIPPSPDDPFYAEFASRLPPFREKLAGVRSCVKFSTPELFWHPYDVLANIGDIGDLLTGANRDLHGLIAGLPVADIGAADGDLSFFLESCGVKNIHILEHAPTSCNRLEGARLLKKELDSSVQIHECDIDSPADLPLPRWGMVFLLGTLYHLKNPYYILEKLAGCTRYCMLSTRITRFAPDGKTDLSAIPMAYLLDATECNNDPTNFWVFTRSGLRRIVTRAGWNIREFMTCGSPRSTPASMEHTGRAFCLLESRACGMTSVHTTGGDAS